jgi:hypothetical protein
MKLKPPVHGQSLNSQEVILNRLRIGNTRTPHDQNWSGPLTHVWETFDG